MLNLAIAEHQALETGEAIEEVEGKDSEEPDVCLTYSHAVQMRHTRTLYMYTR